MLSIGVARGRPLDRPSATGPLEATVDRRARCLPMQHEGVNPNTGKTTLVLAQLLADVYNCRTADIAGKARWREGRRAVPYWSLASPAEIIAKQPIEPCQSANHDCACSAHRATGLEGET